MESSEVDIPTLLVVVAIVLTYALSVSLISSSAIKFYDSRGHSIRGYADPKCVVLAHSHIMLGLLMQQTIELLTALRTIRPFPSWAISLFSGVYLWSMVDILCLHCFWRSRTGNICHSLRPLVLGAFLPLTVLTAFPLICSHTVSSSMSPETDRIIQMAYDSMCSLIPFVLTLTFLSTTFWNEGHSKRLRLRFVTQSVLCVVAAVVLVALSLFFRLDPTPKRLLAVEVVAIAATFTLWMLSMFHFPMVLVSDAEHRRKECATASNVELNQQSLTNSVFTRTATRTLSPSSPPTMGQLVDCLRDKHSFYQFRAHLESEFAAENLNFITELIQIKHEYQGSDENVLVSRNVSPHHGEYVVLDFNDKSSGDDDDGDTGLGDGESSPSVTAEQSFAFNVKGRGAECLSSLDDEKSSDSVVGDGDTPSPPLSPVALPDLMMGHMTIPSIAPQSLSKLMMRSPESERADHVITSYVFNGVGSAQEMLTLSIPADVARTEVMTEHEGDLMAQCLALYAKYVRIGSEFEINLPYSTRKDVEAQIEDGALKNLSDLFWTFDAPCVLILRLLMASFQRFKCKMRCSPSLTATTTSSRNTEHRRGGPLYHRVLAKYSS